MRDQDPIARLNAALEGRYRIERQLGEGGMATVYLADDLKHERKVALKVLKPELAAVVGAERFVAEIKTTANLQHPHILPLFDSGEADGFLFYVMPYVEGESLRERLDREHQLPVDEAVAIATKVAGALQAAHERGVIHRDIKPGNILLSKGEPLVSDFGIALALGNAGAGRLTETGLSLGTPHYMSPEQATGDRSVGPATDIYALGCVLYEMLLGEPPYTGSTPQAILGKIIQADPVSATKSRRSVPPNVDAAIRKALEKVPADRFTNGSGFTRALAEPGFLHGAEAVAATKWAWSRTTSLFAGLFGIAVVALAWSVLRPAASRSLLRSVLTPPPGALTATGADEIRGIAVSPHGRTVVFSNWPEGHVYRGSVDQVDAVQIPGVENALYLFFSPDGEWVGYLDWGGQTLRKIRLDGSGAQTLASVSGIDFRGASWGTDGYIVVSLGRTLWRVRDSGGELEEIATNHDGALWPDLLPGGRAILAQTADPDPAIVAVSLESGDSRTLLPGATPRYVATGHVIFWRAGRLWAVPFDPDRLQVLGPATPIEEEEGVRHFAVDGNLLFYQEGPRGATGMQQLVVVDVEGREEPLALTPRNIGSVGWCGEDESVVYEADGQIYTYDGRLNTTPRQLTSEGNNRRPVCSPDGNRVVFSSAPEGTGGADLFVKDLDGDSPPRSLIALEGDQFATHWPADTLILFEQVEGQNSDLWTLNLSNRENPVPEPYLSSEADLRNMVVSRDLRFAAYASGSDSLGIRYQTYVNSFPVPGESTVISEYQGWIPYWSPDGSILYYTGGPGLPFVAVHLRDPGPVVIGADTLRFLSPAGNGRPPYPGSGLHPDGDRFIFALPAGPTAAAAPTHSVGYRLIRVQNWSEQLKHVASTN